MKTYAVKLPITGYVYLEVEAESEEQAIGNAIASEEYTHDKIEEWDVRKAIVRGNVFCGILNQAEADLIDDGEE